MLWSYCLVPGVCPEVSKHGWVTMFSPLVEFNDGFQGWFQGLGPGLVVSKFGLQDLVPTKDCQGSIPRLGLNECHIKIAFKVSIVSFLFVAASG